LRRVTGAGDVVAESQAARDETLYRVAGLLALVGAVVLALGASLPWVTYVVPRRAAIQRDSFQLGAAISSIGIGPIIVAAACVLLAAGVLTILHPIRPNLVMPLVPVLVAGLVVANSWNQVYGSSSVGTSSLNPGVILCLLGLAFGLGSSVVLLFAEHPKTGRASPGE
jgi:hypothetical protein